MKSTPSDVTLEAAKEEYERAGRYRWLVTSLAADGPKDSEQFRKLREAMQDNLDLLNTLDDGAPHSIGTYSRREAASDVVGVYQ